MARRKSRVENMERVDRMSMSIFNSKDMQSMHQSLNGEFMLYQLILKRLLNKVERSIENPSGLFDYFQPDDENDQQTMKEYDRTYRVNQAIYWYTKESCIYRMLNKALRTQNIHHILGFGSFIRDLFLQLSSQQRIFIKQLEIPFLQVYRGQFISKDEVIRMKSSIGQLIAMNSFLSTSTNREQALTFATSKSPPSVTLTSILLEITVYACISSFRPYADIKSLSAYPKEEEILFMLGCMFRIDDVFQDEVLKVWRIKLTLCNDDDEDVRAFSLAFDKDINGKDQLVLLGHYLLQMQKFDEAQRHYETLLDNQLITNDFDFATCYYGLAQVNIKKGDLNSALENLKISLDYLSKKITNQNHSLVSQCYNDCGSIYDKKGDYIHALNYYNQALITPNNDPMTTYSGLAEIEIHLGNYKLALEYQNKCLFEASSNVNQSKLANIYLNMGKIYALMNEQKQALTMFEQSINIQTKSLHSTHPDLGYTYNAIGLMYLDLNDDKRAFKFIEKAFEIQLQSLPHNHPDFIDTFKNFGNFHLKKGDFNQALYYFNKSLDTQLKIFSSKHPIICDTYVWIGKVLLEKNDYDQALEYFHKSLDNQLERKKPSDPTLVSMYELLGTTYLKKFDYDQALIYFEKLLNNELDRKVAEDMSLLKIYQTIAEIYDGKNHFQRALVYYYRMLDCQLQIRPFLESSVIDLYTIIGRIYLKKPFDQTFVQFNQATDIVTTTSLSDTSLLDVHTKIGNVHFEKRHLDQVFKYFQQTLAEQLKKKSSDKTSLSETYAILGNIAMEKHDFDEAFIYFQEFIKQELQVKTGQDPSLADKYKVMGDICFEKHDFDQALSYYNRFFNCKSSLQGSTDSIFVSTYIMIGKIYLCIPLEKLLKNLQQTTNCRIVHNQNSEIETRYLHLVLAFFQQCVNHHRIKLSQYRLSLVEGLLILANLFLTLDNLDIALKYYYRLLSKQLEKTTTTSSSSYLSLTDTYKIIATVNYSRRNWNEALIYCEKFLESEIRQKTSYDREFIDIYSMMGSIYFERCEFDQSLFYYDRLIGCLLQKIPLNQPLLVVAYKRVGKVYLKQTLSKLYDDKIMTGDTPVKNKHTSELLEYFLNLIKDSTQTYFSSADLYKIIAGIYLKRKDLDSTLLYLGKLLEDITNKDTIRTSFRVDLYKTFAKIHCEMNHFDQGLFYINQLLDCQSRRNSFDENALIEAYEIVGKLHLQHHHFHQMDHAIRKLYEKSIERRPSTMDVDKAIQQVYYEKRHLSKTLTYFQNLLAQQVKTSTWDHPSVQNTIKTIKNLFLHKDDIQDGIVFFEKLLNQQLKSHPLGDVCTANFYQILGHFYADIHDFSKSLENFQRSFSIYERYHPSTHPTMKKLKHEMRKLFLFKSQDIL